MSDRKCLYCECVNIYEDDGGCICAFPLDKIDIFHYVEILGKRMIEMSVSNVNYYVKKARIVDMEFVLKNGLETGGF